MTSLMGVSRTLPESKERRISPSVTIPEKDSKSLTSANCILLSSRNRNASLIVQFIEIVAKANSIVIVYRGAGAREVRWLQPTIALSHTRKSGIKRSPWKKYPRIPREILTVLDRRERYSIESFR